MSICRSNILYIVVFYFGIKMERTRQNLFLFFEETDDERDISSNLVHLYMNRFVICEEDQTEIIGAYNLSKTDEKAKLEHDQSLFEKLRSEIDSFRQTGQNNMNHFLIGSSYYINTYNSSRSIVENLIDKNYNEVEKNLRELELKIISPITLEITRDELNISTVHIHFQYTLKDILDRLEDELAFLERSLNTVNPEYLLTILKGSQSNFLTTTQVKLAHAGSKNANGLTNNDLEEYHQLIMTSTKQLKINVLKSLSLYKQLTDPEIEKLKPSLLDRTYEIELNQQKWTTQKSLEVLLPLLATTDPGYQYLQCDCQRYSFSKLNEFKERIWKSRKDIQTLRSGTDRPKIIIVN